MCIFMPAYCCRLRRWEGLHVYRGCSDGGFRAGVHACFEQGGGLNIERVIHGGQTLSLK